ncbi:CIC11C00000001622 [Sungouiella intermedia]|uniref:CIC11C00000001622 n=1 Tax=Sungouiella intermedia TaxID=45354 RepID=A0A1L0CYM9_9ASCO|nr:CIC11C00000001622 [[Candida] intermedia]
MIMSVHDTLSRKRDMPQDLLPDQKRSRVDSSDAFSDKMYSVYVKSAMESMEKNDPLKINALAAKINLPLSHSESISLTNFNILLRSLIVNVSKLDNNLSAALVGAVLRYSWLEIPAEAKNTPAFATFLDLYSQFLGVLVSSLPKYLHEVIKKIVKEFPDISGDAYPHHRVLQRLVTYIPTCINSIPPMLAKNFPHHLSSNTEEITNYVRNCVRVISYCPDLQFSIWQMVVECCIKLDVELQNELDDLDDDSIEELINGDDDEIDDAEMIEDPNDIEVYTVTSTVNIKKLVSKLDSTLELLLQSTASSFTTEQIEAGTGVNLFNTLMSLFKTHILPTHFTKSIQFLMFHISQYQPELADAYLVLLIDVAFSPNEITEKRLKALQYLSSYIARAKGLTKHQIVFIVSYLTGWINKYIAEREHEVFEFSEVSSMGGMERFKLFYATIQALIYIFCFRHQQLSKSPEDIGNSDSEWECDLDKFFQRVIIAKFNPLKYCDETVVYIFAKIATKLNVCYCYSIIEHNKRETMMQGNSSLPSAVGNFRHKQEFLDLEAYFPFDPLVLPNCKKIITVNYVEWKDVNPSNDDDDDEDSGSHPEDDDDEDDEEEDDEEDIEDDEDKEDEAKSADEDSDEENTSDEEE